MIRYKLFQCKNKNSEFYNKWYGRSVCEETIGTRELAKHIASHGSPFSVGSINGILTDVVACIKELVLDGKNVKIDDLAIFSIGIVSKPAPTAKEFDAHTNIATFKLRARPTGEFTKAQLMRVANIMEATYYKPVAKTTANDGEQNV